MFIRNIACVVFSLWLLNVALAQKQMSGRIVGGELTTIDKLPYLVQILVRDRFICGGSLLSDMFVVTAAHCVINTVPKDITVVGGATKLSENGHRRGVQKLLIPKGYNPMTMHMDVAILKLGKSMNGSNTGKIDLYMGELTAGLMAHVSGWGLTSEGGQISDQVRTVTVPIIDKSTCTRQYANFVRLSSSMFCASTPGAKDSCSGDSGGPVVCNGKLCGIVSFGIGCARRGFPGVYTSTKAVNSFIQNCLKL